MSGILKLPPISTSSPRETIALAFNAIVLSASTTAAALLFTTVAASAPVNSQINCSMAAARAPYGQSEYRTPRWSGIGRLEQRPQWLLQEAALCLSWYEARCLLG